MEFSKIKEIVNAYKLIGTTTKTINIRIKLHNYKVCCDCDNLLKITEFTKSGNKTSGFKSKCKTCVADKNKNYYAKTKRKTITCECGLMINYSNRYEHKKSQKHINRIAQ